MTSYLHRQLARVVDYDAYVAGDFTDDDKKEAIRRAGNGTSAYADQIWNCAEHLRAGDLDAAMAAIGK
jgi:hypothetical protein